MSDESKEYLQQHLTDAEFNALVNAKSEQEWSDLCDAVKAKRDGAYPREWFVRMNMSGLMSQIFKRWQ